VTGDMIQFFCITMEPSLIMEPEDSAAR
jgi:hypothetical protein